MTRGANVQDCSMAAATGSMDHKLRKSDDVCVFISSTLSIHDELNRQKLWKIHRAGGFWDITWLPRTLHKVSVSQKARENSHFLISNNG